MTPAPVRVHSATRLFAVYALVSLLLMSLVGLALAASYRSEAARRGLDEGRELSELIATTSVEPLLTGTDLRAGMPETADLALRRLTTKAIADGSVLKLRVRDLDGRIVFSDDGENEGALLADDEVLEAAAGEVVAKVTHLGSDGAEAAGRSADGADAGTPRVVEAYRPLRAGPVSTKVGVLEVYLPYEPIAGDISRGLNVLYAGLAAGLGGLFVVLAGLSYLTTRGLRRQSTANAYLAEHDQLTGLANRRVFEQRLDELGGGASRAAVAVLDLDRFKEVNDTIGHVGGDQMIEHLARRLAAGAGPSDLVARLGGDEFGIVLADVSDAAEATTALEGLRALVSEPLTLAGVPLTAEVSIGYVLAPEDGEGAALLQRADIAMYAAKATHAGVLRYDPADDHYDSDRLALAGELRRALTNEELVLHYQPKLRLAGESTGDEVRSVEALVRWNHPRRGLLFPDSFIPAAEQTGLIDGLTDWVLAAALDQLRRWDAAGTRIDVAINVSARNLTSPKFAERVLQAVFESGLAARRLRIEVTETALFTDIDRATCALARLHGAGIRISLDDFGRGQTSLGYLAQLPLTELKIDRTFVSDMCSSAPNAAIVRSVIDLAHNLGLSVVAEGVEDDATMQGLRELGCDVAQGYVLSRPMASEALLAWLEAHRRAAAPALQ